MRIFYHINDRIYDAQRNLAFEEAVFNSDISDAIVLFWQNKNAVIIGKNQIAQEEIDEKFVLKNNIQVVRRITGGGAVYHDLGNLNFSVIKRKDQPFNFYDILLDSLKDLGLPVSLSGRNDILLDNKKISGNAVYHKGNKSLYHGTLLYDIDSEKVSKSLTPDTRKLSSKGVSSVQSRITNLKNYLPEDSSISDIQSKILDSLEKKYSIVKLETDYQISQNYLELIKKYRDPSWTFSRQFNNNYYNSINTPHGIITIFLKLKKNRISDVKITGDFFQLKNIEELENQLKNIPINEIDEKIDTLQIETFIMGLENHRFKELFQEIDRCKYT